MKDNITVVQSKDVITKQQGEGAAECLTAGCGGGTYLALYGGWWSLRLLHVEQIVDVSTASIYQVLL